MILYINTASGENIELALGQDDILIAKSKIKAKYKQSEKLLVEIDKLLKKSNKFCSKLSSKRSKVQSNLDLSQLKAIVVVSGPGSFTATRIGVATANALAYSLKIPVFSVKNIDFSDFEELISLSGKQFSCRKKKSYQAVEPFYNKKPNITKSKKIY